MKIIFTLIFTLINIIKSFTDEDLSGVALFQNEVCSFNGIPTLIQSTNTIQCECKQQYATDYKARTINNHTVYCNYRKKRRLIALFFSVFLPFGVNYFYLEYVWLPFIIMIIFITIVVLNCVFFCKKEEQERENSDNGIIDSNVNKNEKIIMWVLLSSMFLYIAFIIVNICLMCFGSVKDANGFEMYNDLLFYKNTS